MNASGNRKVVSFVTTPPRSTPQSGEQGVAINHAPFHSVADGGAHLRNPNQQQVQNSLSFKLSYRVPPVSLALFYLPC